VYIYTDLYTYRYTTYRYIDILNSAWLDKLDIRKKQIACGSNMNIPIFWAIEIYWKPWGFCQPLDNVVVEVLVVPSLRHVYFELSAGRFRSQMITEIQGILLAIRGSFCGQSQTTKTGREVPAVGGFVLWKCLSLPGVILAQWLSHLGCHIFWDGASASQLRVQWCYVRDGS
jgi:hypothetical protein